MSQAEPNRTVVPQFVRPLAVAALLAFALGRTFGPALRGAREGLDHAIATVDFAGGFASYLFAFWGFGTLIAELMMTYRERSLGLFHRVATLIFGFSLLFLTTPALREPLPEGANIIAAVASGMLALFAGRQALAVPRTRALGVLMLAAGLAALLHISGSFLAWIAGERALYRLAVFARVLATGSVVFDTVVVLTAFAWLATRSRATTVWSARIALFVGCAIAWGAARTSLRDSGQLWQIVTYRALDRMITMPAPYVWQPFRYVLEACAPLLAVTALTARGQIPAIVGSMALALLARPSTDVPLSAIALGLAALSTALAARDDRGMWQVLLAENKHRVAS